MLILKSVSAPTPANSPSHRVVLERGRIVGNVEVFHEVDPDGEDGFVVCTNRPNSFTQKWFMTSKRDGMQIKC